MGPIRVVAVVVGVLALAGCGGASNGEQASSGAPAKQDSGAVAKPQVPAQVPAQGKSAQGTSQGTSQGSAQGSAQGTSAGQNDPTITRAIIKTGSLIVEGDDVSAMRQKAVTAIAGLDGQVASEDTSSNQDGKITQSNLVLKVPTKSFETAIQQLSGLGKRLQVHQESEDVTEQVVDVASRIESQRASLDRMRALMTKANTIGDIVSVESELTRRESDLEALLAKQKNLSLQTDLATLTLTLTEKGKPPVQTQKPDKGFVAGLKSGWHAFTATFSAVATAIGALLPFLILLAILAVPLWRFRHKLRKQPAGQ
ncbi:outer membrane murein-binding lipoprotein Lpp [Kribbella aluminosa]|uniref:Outer membrane murein-binding lipoprotein Lpp n=1 Tax=Kribbella aluminosa TaxID=416017 RepID=A0ABS4UFP1_9ACTN|nr:DUF4349 domain-containing protein [Kribbella aluminosa]MBP2350446.1 outer membrane murein-binding lipoprotein Lpp [Kribbella aluminosa]